MRRPHAVSATQERHTRPGIADPDDATHGAARARLLCLFVVRDASCWRRPHLRPAADPSRLTSPFGVGFATAQLTSLLLADVPVEESGQASGLQSTVRQLGSALGVALLGGFLVAQLGRATRDNLATLGLPGEAVDGIANAVRESAGIAIAGFQADPAQAAVAQSAGEAMITASQLTTGLAAVALFIGLIAVLALPKDAAAVAAAEAEAEPEETVADHA